MNRMTLFNMLAGLMLFMGTVNFIMWRAGRRKTSGPGPLWFSIGYWCGGVAIFLQAYRGILPDFLSIIIGNGLFLLLYIFLERAMALYSNRRNVTWWLVALDAATVANFAYFTYVKPDLMLRTLEAAAVSTLMVTPIIVHGFRNHDQVIRPAMRAISWTLIIHVTLNAIRMVAVLHLHQPDAWFSWAAVITTMALALSILWIDALQLRDELEQRAMTDPLTGLLNRRALEDCAARELSRSQRSGAPVSALAIDINRFKQINDTYGHAAGDIALCAVAKALKSSLRNTDLATRIGGDEFFVLLPETDELSADLVVSRLRSTLRLLQLETFYGTTFQISISIGTITSRSKDTTVQDLFENSDIMLYREKQAFWSGLPDQRIPGQLSDMRLSSQSRLVLPKSFLQESPHTK